MRTEDEIQKAHDILLAVLLGETPLGLTEEQKTHMIGCADALCFVLEHSHNDILEKNIKNIDNWLNSIGVSLKPIDIPNIPQEVMQAPEGSNIVIRIIEERIEEN